MSDPTETTRRQMVQEINSNPGSREYLQEQHGQVWNTQELQRDFIVLAFSSPFVLVTEKASGQRGSLQFQHDPRLYYSFQAE